MLGNIPLVRLFHTTWKRKKKKKKKLMKTCWLWKNSHTQLLLLLSQGIPSDTVCELEDASGPMLSVPTTSTDRSAAVLRKQNRCSSCFTQQRRKTGLALVPAVRPQYAADWPKSSLAGSQRLQVNGVPMLRCHGASASPPNSPCRG